MALSGKYIALALALAPAGGSGLAADETVRIRFQHPFGVCAGLCPDFETRVEPSGAVASRSLHWEGGDRFRASPRQYAAFLRIMNSIRPTGERSLDRSCEHARSADGAIDPLDTARPDDVEIQWSGTRGAARLTSCAYSHMDMRHTVENALRALGANPYNGRRAQPGD